MFYRTPKLKYLRKYIADSWYGFLSRLRGTKVVCGILYTPQ